MNRRVLDKRDNSIGTAVLQLYRGHYRVKWDEPTPYQDGAVVPIPSENFIWVEARPQHATSTKEN